MDLNIEQMKELIDLFEGTDLSEISVQQDDFQVTLKKNSLGETGLGSGDTGTQGIAYRGSEEETNGPKKEKEGSAAGGATEEKSEEKNAITSPIVGTFYRSPSPEEPPYLEVGDRVEKGDTVCIVEAMKVMNEVKADQGGEVVDICVEDGDSVEYGQNLFILASPDKGS
ncbi:MAG: acetyl-CoA carboxylase biotin carboxyl carrier protein [Candidatus Bipolaricaulota bacterium]|nr:acetyl-CoA carboxylase biotin carboxyl carrier protein [Candidatus Bipolaricaulota bacterium]MBS3792210.1 acetyl-CoA carboxylase biotin carboxyl carrier protein [Candidatus Bipolaricaulota bacterium]